MSQIFTFMDFCIKFPKSETVFNWIFNLSQDNLDMTCLGTVVFYPDFVPCKLPEKNAVKCLFLEFHKKNKGFPDQVVFYWILSLE